MYAHDLQQIFWLFVCKAFLFDEGNLCIHLAKFLKMWKEINTLDS